MGSGFVHSGRMPTSTELLEKARHFDTRMQNASANDRKAVNPYIRCMRISTMSWLEGSWGKKHTKSKPLSQATRRQKQNKMILNAEQRKKTKTFEKRQRKRHGRMGFSGYHLLVFSRGRLFF